MYTLLLFGFFLVGFTLGWVGAGGFTKQNKTKRCPWPACGYPVPENPLVVLGETYRDYGTFSVEKCEGCDQSILWNPFLKKYERKA